MNPDLIRAFDRVRIISLPDRTDRRMAVTQELQRLGLELDGQQIAFFDAIRPGTAGAFPSAGARGCFMSHLEVLRQARADGVNRLLVMEDDVMFTTPGEAPRRLAEELVNDLADDRWYLCYPGHARAPLPGPLRWVEVRDPIVCAHCYGVPGQALDELIAYLEACLIRPAGHPEGGPMHIDGALTLMRTLRPHWRTWVASRPLALQRSSRSDIAGPSWIDRVPLPGLAPAARGLRNRWRRLLTT